MSDLRNSNPYDLKTQKDEGYLYEEKPNYYLTTEEFISFLNRKKILIERADNLPRFCNNNNIVMAKIKRVNKFGSTPTVYKIPRDSKIEEILQSLKNNNNSLIGRVILEKKKKKILEIFNNAPSAKDYEKKKDMAETEKEKKEITRKKLEKCESKTSIAKKVSDALGVNCNRKLVSSVLKKRSSQLDKLLKIK